MYRRAFLAISTATLLSVPAWAGDDLVTYKPGVIQSALDDGKTVFVDYFAPWCSTCRTQERRVQELRAENPEYDRNLVFIRVDWDTYRNHEVVTGRAIPRRSTLLVLRGKEELGRIVAGTSKAEIKALLDAGLAPQG
jgi:thiol-disulfide isomerase/thioredoxin